MLWATIVAAIASILVWTLWVLPIAGAVIGLQRAGAAHVPVGTLLALVAAAVPLLGVLCAIIAPINALRRRSAAGD